MLLVNLCLDIRLKNIESANLYLLLSGCPHIIHDNEARGNRR